MTYVKIWVLTDVDSDIYVENWSVSSVDLGLKLPTPWTIRKRRLRGGLRDGVDLIEVDNGRLRYAICPTRGMGLWRGWSGDTFLGWQAPVKGPVHPAFVNQHALGGLGWLEGFDEWIVRCGLYSNGGPGMDVIKDDAGAEKQSPVTLHGRIANLPAHTVEVVAEMVEPYRVTVRGVVDEAMLFFPQLRLTAEVTTTPGSPSLTIRDQIRNLKGQPSDCQMLYHCNFGPPLMEEGAKLLAPCRSVAPRDGHSAEDIDDYDRYSGPIAGVQEYAYWLDLAADAEDRTLAVLQNAAGDRACALRFNKKQLPYFTLWKNPAAIEDGYVTGLEPGTNLPNVKGFERSQGRVVPLPVGGSYEMEVTIEAANGADEVDQLRQEVDRLQQQVERKVHSSPLPEFSPQP